MRRKPVGEEHRKRAGELLFHKQVVEEAHRRRVDEYRHKPAEEPHKPVDFVRRQVDSVLHKPVDSVHTQVEIDRTSAEGANHKQVDHTRPHLEQEVDHTSPSPSRLSTWTVVVVDNPHEDPS
jgi:hypothetical protein